MDVFQQRKTSIRLWWRAPPRHISAMCLFERMSHVRNKHKTLCSVENVKLKVALPRTRPHMCNGNVAPKHMRNPANPHEWEQKWTSSLAFHYVATLTDGSIKPKNKIFNPVSDVRFQRSSWSVLPNSDSVTLTQCAGWLITQPAWLVQFKSAQVWVGGGGFLLWESADI